MTTFKPISMTEPRIPTPISPDSTPSPTAGSGGESATPSPVQTAVERPLTTPTPTQPTRLEFVLFKKAIARIYNQRPMPFSDRRIQNMLAILKEVEAQDLAAPPNAEKIRNQSGRYTIIQTEGRDRFACTDKGEIQFMRTIDWAGKKGGWRYLFNKKTDPIVACTPAKRIIFTLDRHGSIACRTVMALVDEGEQRERALNEYNGCHSAGVLDGSLPGAVDIWNFAIRTSKKGHEKILCDMPYYVRGDLFDNLTTLVKKWDVPKKAALLLRLAQTLEHLHDKKEVVHRDIKTENILLDSNYMPFLSDFEFILSIAQAKGAKERGSPIYFPPEALMSILSPSECHRDPDPSMDMWGLGIISWMLFTGQCPKWLTPAAGFDIVNDPLPKYIRALTSQVKEFSLQIEGLTGGTAEQQALLKGLLAYDPDKRLKASGAVKILQAMAAPATKSPSPVEEKADSKKQ